MFVFREIHPITCDALLQFFRCVICDLIPYALRGEAAAFGELVTLFQTALFDICYRNLHEPTYAEDMAQEIFVVFTCN
jgi:hypothetical protein